MVKVYDVMKSIGILKSVENVGDKICKAVGKKWGEEVRGVVERLKGFIKLLEFFGESFSVLPKKLWGIKTGGDYLTYLYSRGFYKTGNNIIQHFNIEENGILEAAVKVENLNLEMFIKNLTLQNISMPLQSLLRRSNTPPTSSLLETYKKYLTYQTSSSSILKRNNGVKNSSVRRGDNSEVYSDEECLRGMELGGRFGRCLREVLEGGKEEGEMVLGEFLYRRAGKRTISDVIHERGAFVQRRITSSLRLFLICCENVIRRRVNSSCSSF